MDDQEGADDCHCREDGPSESAAAARQGVEVIALISHAAPCGWRLQEICLLNAAATMNAV
jgi:hypothetical protein